MTPNELSALAVEQVCDDAKFAYRRVQGAQEGALSLVACQVKFDATVYHLGVCDEPHVARTRDAQHDAHVLRVLGTVDIDRHAAGDTCVLNAFAMDVSGLSADVEATVKLAAAYQARGFRQGQKRFSARWSDVFRMLPCPAHTYGRWQRSALSGRRKPT